MPFMKDLFSSDPRSYSLYRPSYPISLFDFLLTWVPIRDRAWDCGTGNGQVARELSKHFKKVFATDISPSQIKEAPKASNIDYSVQPAERTDFPASFKSSSICL